MRGKISKRSVDALEATDGKEATLWDVELRGFGVRARRGGGKTYVLRYRPGGGGRSSPLRTLTIGGHGSPWTPDQARDEAKRLLGLIQGGADPAADRSSRRDAPTIAQLADRFLAEHMEAKRKASTTAEYRRLLEKRILPALGAKKTTDITRQDIARFHHANRGEPYQANRCLSVLSKMMNLAERWGLRPDGSNPCRHVEKFAEQKRERMLSGEELGRLGGALASYDRSPYAPAAVKLLVFTGARLSEVLGLRWEWVDFEHGEARLPDSKTGAKTLHLPPPAMAVLADLPRLDGNPFVIAGSVAGESLVNLQRPWRQIREAAGLDDVRLHDLRHAFASVAANSGMGLPIIGKMLGHTQAATTQRYAHLASDPVKAAAATVAGKISDAMDARPSRPSGEVVSLPQKRGSNRSG